MDISHAPYHAHVYYDVANRVGSESLRDLFIELSAEGSNPQISFVGMMVDRPIGPHPIPQYEVHFRAEARAKVITMIEAAGMRALVHPLTDDDLADHTTLGHWIGEPIELDISVLDPPGVNQGVPRFGKSDF
jgi:aromatic ring-cleaving dioxygenase